MILFNYQSSEVVDDISIVIELEHALELIRMLAHLIRCPEFHHSHLFGPLCGLDIVVIDPDGQNTYMPALQKVVDQYFGRQQDE